MAHENEANEPEQSEEQPFDTVDFIVQFEAGELDDEDVIEGFQHLLDTGLIYSLQGCYHRTASNLLSAGLIFHRPQPRPN